MAQKTRKTNKPKIRIITVAVLVAAFLILANLVNVIVDYWWFQEMGQTQVFWTPIKAQSLLFAGFFVATILILVLNSWAAVYFSPGWGKKNTEKNPFASEDHNRTYVNPNAEQFNYGNTQEQFVDGQTQARTVDDFRVVTDGVKALFEGKEFKTSIENANSKMKESIRLIVSISMLIIAFVIAFGESGAWQNYLLAFQKVSFGVADPQYGLDVGFYIFQLPVIQHAMDWLNTTLGLSIVVVAAIYLLGGAIQPWRKSNRFAPAVKTHLSILLATFMLWEAGRNVIRMLELVHSNNGKIYGASYTDIHVGIPAYIALIVISLIIAILLIINIRFKGWKLPTYGLIAYTASFLLLSVAAPWLVQQLLVAPNETAYETPYIERNIDMTRRAFNLTDVKGKTFAAIDNLDENAVQENEDTFNNIRLWNPPVARKGYEQLQGIRPYYFFSDVDVDRYKVDGKMRQVLISSREIDIDKLAANAKTWVNTHLIYTHGIGAVLNETSTYDRRGLPEFLVGDVPPLVSETHAPNSPDLVIEQPRIYYGEGTYDYAVVNTGVDEFDYPMGETNATYRYTGDAGIEVGGIFKRLLLSLHEKSRQLFFSSYIDADSRLLIRRNIEERVSTIAPWLHLEPDYYSAVVDGRHVWVIDGYTMSDKYPYSEPHETDRINYVRNSIKITVDAYTGETIFYAFDTSDPILQAYMGVYPELFTHAEEMPETLRAHLRYPQTLFSWQAEIFTTYHMTDPLVFYNREDQWAIPTSNGEKMEPFFVLIQLPGSTEEHFVMLTPFTPRNRDNMIGWMAVSSDPENYGERTVYLFPKDRVVLGPTQITARINQDPVISPQFTLWNQRGSEVTFGDMIVLPVQDSIVYVQSVFLQAEQTAIPELTAVVVAYGDRLVMHRNYDEALKEVFAANGVAQPSPEPGAEDPGAQEPTPPLSPTDPNASLEEQAASLYAEAMQAQKQGDWALYGSKIKELGRVLEELSR